MKTEVAAGGIIIRNNRGTWEALLVQDMNNVWTFPKGRVEKNESYEVAAAREIREETGLTHISLLFKLPLVRYMYERDGVVDKTVHYFLFELTKEEPVIAQTEEGIHNATWMSVDRAIELTGYTKTNKELLILAKQWMLHRHQISTK